MSKKLFLHSIIRVENDSIYAVELKESKSYFSWKIIGNPSNDLQRAIDEWMSAFASCKQFSMELPVFLRTATSFASSVYSTMIKIPFGARLSYAELADQSGYPKAARAVGNLCRINPCPLFVPCHRIVRKDGKIGRFSQGDTIKSALLDFESL